MSQQNTIEENVAALEAIFFQETNNYYNTSALQGKPWYGIGLEDNTSNASQDNTAKKNIVQRMIAAIVEFIGKILKKIKEFFIVDKDKEELKEFGQQYKGPTPEDLKKASAKEAKKTAPAASAPAADAKPAAPSEDDVQVSHASNVTGQQVDVEKAKKFYNGEKMALISAMLSKDRLAIIAALLDDKYAGIFETLVDAAYDAVDKDAAPEEAVTKLTDALEACKNFIKDYASKEDRELKNILSTWIMGKDPSAAGRIRNYFKGNTDIMKHVNFIEKPLERLKDKIEKLKFSNDQDELDSLKHYQGVVSKIAEFFSFIMQLDNAYCTALRGLRK